MHSRLSCNGLQCGSGLLEHTIVSLASAYVNVGFLAPASGLKSLLLLHLHHEFTIIRCCAVKHPPTQTGMAITKSLTAHQGVRQLKS
jgi:hypothetical protein